MFGGNDIWAGDFVELIGIEAKIWGRKTRRKLTILFNYKSMDLIRINMNKISKSDIKINVSECQRQIN
jgi:hypothetical protein